MILITQPRVGISHNEILSLHFAARELGWEVYPAPTSWRLEDELIKSGKIGVPYGSQMFCEVIAQQMNWKLLSNPFDWLTKVPKKYLKRNVQFMSLGEAKKIKETKFIKPADDKCFDAKVYEAGSFSPNEIISDDYPVLVSDVVKFTHEYRCFIKGTKCVTWSCYVYGEEVANPKNWHKHCGYESPDKFVNRVLSKMNCKPATVNSVIDIGPIEGATWAVIETNPIWASGIYGCDPIQVLLAMQDSCVKYEK